MHLFRLRDPRLLRNMGLALDAQGISLRELQPLRPQHSGAAPPSGAPGCPGSPQEPCPIRQQGVTLNNHTPHMQCDSPAASTDTSTSKKKCDQEEGLLSHRTETRSLNVGDQEWWVSSHTKRNSDGVRGSWRRTAAQRRNGFYSTAEQQRLSATTIAADLWWLTGLSR